jgi:hypothetical protein
MGHGMDRVAIASLQFLRRDSHRSTRDRRAAIGAYLDAQQRRAEPVVAIKLFSSRCRDSSDDAAPAGRLWLPAGVRGCRGLGLGSRTARNCPEIHSNRPKCGER